MGKQTKLILLGIVIFICTLVTGTSASTKMTDLPRHEQINVIKKDIASIHPDMARDVYVLFDYIRKKNKKMEPIVSYLVARRTVEHAIIDNRMDRAMPRLSYFSLIVGIMDQESTFNPAAVSHANARGLMQVHVPTWKKHIEVDKIHDVQKNIQYGTSIFYKYFSEQGSVTKALFKYYGAPDSKYAQGVLSRAIRFRKFYDQNQSLAVQYVEKIRAEYVSKHGAQ